MDYSDYNRYNQGNVPYQQLNDSTVSVGDWVLTAILTAIPIVNIIMLFVWAFGSSTKKSKSNWAKAQLIIILIGIVISIIATLLLGALFGAIMSNY